MNYSLEIYKVDKGIERIFEDEDNYDPETGEFLAEAEINALQINRNILFHDLAIINISRKGLAEMIDGEIKRLQALKKSAVSKSETAKRIIGKLLPKGEKMDLGDVKFSWRKSSEVVCDEFLDLADLAGKHPELVKISHELRKTEVKNMLKDTGIIPDGIRIIENQNLQIK